MIPDEQWQVIAGALRSLPAQEKWTDETSETYRMMLAHLDAGQLMKALTDYAQTGKTFRPTWADLLRIASGVSDGAFIQPSEVWPLLERAVRKVGCSPYAKEFPERHQAAIDWLRTQDEAVAAYASRRGLAGRGSIGHDETGDPQWGHVAVKRIQGEYADVRARAVERAQLGKPAFEERAFLVRGTGEGGGGVAELLERLRPVRELEAGDGPPSPEAVAFLRRMNEPTQDERDVAA